MNRSLYKRGGVKLDHEPEILFARSKGVVSRFVKLAIQEETHLIYPVMQRLKPESWIRNKNILGSYLLSSATQEDIGKIYSLRQRSISAQLRNSIRYLWLNASPELKKQFILPQKEVRPKKRVIRKPQSYKSSSKPAVLLPEGKPMHPKLKEALSGVNFTFIDPLSREFLKQAFNEEAHLITPPGMNSERWIAYRNIFGTYILSHATLGQVGDIFGISRERVRQINSEVLHKIYVNCSDEINQQYHLSSILLDKSVKFLPKEWLLVKDNLGSDIVETLEQGFSPNQIKSRSEKGYPRKQVIEALKMLRELRFKVKRIKSAGGEYLRIEQELLREDLSDEETQTLLDQVDGMRGIEVLRTCGVIISIRKLLFSAGYHIKIFQQQPFYDALIDAGIPLGMTEFVVHSGPQKGRHYYFFIASRHKQRAEEALRANPNLTKFLENPVKQVSGPKTKIPSTTKLAKKDGVLGLGSILTEFGIPVSSSGKKFIEIKSALVVENTLPVFVYDGTYFILEADLQKARSFIKAWLEYKNS